MFLLLLMGLGAAGVKAQVRIGGDGAPNPAAVLDLNATDATTGTKGLALPRVSLTNVSTPLTGTPVVNGMMVYNTNDAMTGGDGPGIYYWASNSWNKLVAPRTTTQYVLNRVLDTVVYVSYATGFSFTNIYSTRLAFGDFCLASGGFWTVVGDGYAQICAYVLGSPGTTSSHVLCYRPV